MNDLDACKTTCDRLRGIIDRYIAENSRQREALEEAKVQIEYLHGKFKSTATGMTVLARINAALAETP